jgi:hypothetical protein
MIFGAMTTPPHDQTVYVRLVGLETTKMVGLIFLAGNQWRLFTHDDDDDAFTEC